MGELTFDDILQRVRFGTYQWRLCLIIGLIDVVDGAELIMLAMVQGILKIEWGLTLWEETMLILCLFIGFLFGALFSGQMSKIFGRKNCLIIVSFSGFLISLATSYAPSFNWFIGLRTLFGLCVGLAGPIASAYITECTPVQYRSLLFSFKGLPFVVGQLFAITLGYFILDGLDSGDWRLYVLLLSLPFLLVSIVVLLYLEPAPRYEILMGDIEVGIKETTNMIEQNGVDLSQDEDFNNYDQRLRSWALRLRSIETFAQKESFAEIFKGKYFYITPVLWITWFSCVFIYYGLIFMVPYTLHQMNLEQDQASGKEDISDLYWGSLAELPAFFVTFMLAEHPYWGRRRSLILGFSCIFMSMGVLFVIGLEWIIQMAAVAKFFMGIAFILTYQYTLEIYETHNRVTGLGTCSGVGRIGGITMPIISIYGSVDDLMYPYIIFCLCSGLSSLALMSISHETHGRQLDQGDDEAMQPLQQQSVKGGQTMKPQRYVLNDDKEDEVVK